MSSQSEFYSHLFSISASALLYIPQARFVIYLWIPTPGLYSGSAHKIQNQLWIRQLGKLQQKTQPFRNGNYPRNDGITIHSRIWISK